MIFRDSLAALAEDMRKNSRQPDDRDAGSIWSWRADDWADRLEAAMAALAKDLETKSYMILARVYMQRHGEEPVSMSYGTQFVLLADVLVEDEMIPSPGSGDRNP